MPESRTFRNPPQNARERLLDTAVDLVRAQGFGAMSVDQLCRAAGVTKGAFFHHFSTKEDLGVALAGHWSDTTGQFFAGGPYHAHPAAIDRVLGYIDFRLELLTGPPEAFGCVAGTMLQENFRTSDAIRRACEASILGNAAAIEPDIAAALADAGLTGIDAASLARHIQTVLQGAFIIAKTRPAAEAAEQAREAVGHLRRYFELLFAPLATEKAA